jgi:hypothetical protein
MLLAVDLLEIEELTRRNETKAEAEAAEHAH